MRTNPLGPIHPGEVLREEVLLPLGMSPYALAASPECAAHADRTPGARGDADHSGYGSEARALLGDHSRILAPSAGAL